jgi:hypothetical protein
MNRILNFLKENKNIIILFLGIVIVSFTIEYLMGRSLLGPDGHFGWWEPSVWSSENSQRVADAYTFSHIAHGLIFYWFLYMVARKMPRKYRFIIAVLLEASWEIFENSPFIINRYRDATIAVGYVGDSILNSISDIFFAGLGFIFAMRMPPWVSVALLIFMEVGCLLWVRDNLTLNVIMLIYPFDAIKVWQSAGMVI